MTTIAELDSALKSAFVQAFLKTLRYCEGTSGENGYSTFFGGTTFTSFDAHPNKVITRSSRGRTISSTAAGAYQFLSRTWSGVAKKYGLTDFTPLNQDRAAVALIAGRKALADVLAGRVQEAVVKCAREWASLPGSPYGQPVKTMEQVLAVFNRELTRRTRSPMG